MSQAKKSASHTQVVHGYGYLLLSPGAFERGVQGLDGLAGEGPRVKLLVECDEWVKTRVRIIYLGWSFFASKVPPDTLFLSPWWTNLSEI